MYNNFRYLYAAVALLVAAASAAADSITIGAARDNTLYESSVGDLSNGAGSFFFAGTDQLLRRRRGLLAFDIHNAVPSGATINSVELTLFMSRTISGDQLVGLHRVTSDWGEGDSMAVGGRGGEGGGGPAALNDGTWLHTFFSSALWNMPGGDFQPAPSATQAVGFGELHTWGSTPEMVGDVQSWLDDPDTNFGWLLKMVDETAPGNAKRFNSRENSDGQTSPRLTIDFTPVPEPRACALFLTGILPIRWRSRR